MANLAQGQLGEAAALAPGERGEHREEGAEAGARETLALALVEGGEERGKEASYYGQETCCQEKNTGLFKGHQNNLKG